jgi:hypothetical protein
MMMGFKIGQTVPLLIPTFILVVGTNTAMASTITVTERMGLIRMTIITLKMSQL